MGSNNSRKTGVLEALFLAPNPLRHSPYGKRMSAVRVLSRLHSTLGSEAYASLLHHYGEDASITFDSNVGASRDKRRIGVS